MAAKTVYTYEVLFDKTVSEDVVEHTEYGDFDVKLSRRDKVFVRHGDGVYDGKMEHTVSYYRNGQYVGGGSYGHNDALAFLTAEVK